MRLQLTAWQQHPSMQSGAPKGGTGDATAGNPTTPPSRKFQIVLHYILLHLEVIV